MACNCPNLNITFYSQEVNDGAGNYVYSGQATINAIGGTTQGPINGIITLNANGVDTEYILENPTNSWTYAATTLLAFQNANSITIDLDCGGNCFLTKTIITANTNIDCQTINGGNNGNGYQSIITTCTLTLLVDCSEFVIYGCTDPNSINYNPNATIDDGSCQFPIDVYGCTSPLASNYNPLANRDDDSCIFVTGCTDPTSINYNPNAVIDDGSCVNIAPILIKGCTNPLSFNYNPNANYNDGSCIFISGCTNSLSDNYNPLAIVDDGTCECNDLPIYFNFGQESGITLTLSSGETCDYVVEFEYRILIDCAKVISYFSNDKQQTILDIFNRLKLYNHIIGLSGSTIDYEQLEYAFNKSDIVYPLMLNGDDNCETLLSLLAIELGYECADDIITKFTDNWQSVTFRIPFEYVNKVIKIGINLKGFSFGSTIQFNNLKLSKVCSTIEADCLIVPYNFGFRFNTEIDNKKVIVKNENYSKILNTKELELRLDIPNYINKDVVHYYNTNNNLVPSVFKDLSLEKISKNYVSTDNVFTTKYYPYRKLIYDLYLNSLNYCSTKSKNLDYEFMFAVQNKIGDNWYYIIKDYIPSTAKWKENSRFYANTIFDQQKFKYKKGTLISTCDISIEATCNRIITTQFKSKIDEVLEKVNQNFIKKVELGVMNYNNSPQGSGRFITINKTDNTAIFYTPKMNFVFELC